MFLRCSVSKVLVGVSRIDLQGVMELGMMICLGELV